MTTMSSLPIPGWVPTEIKGGVVFVPPHDSQINLMPYESELKLGTPAAVPLKTLSTTPSDMVMIDRSELINLVDKLTNYENILTTLTNKIDDLIETVGDPSTTLNSPFSESPSNAINIGGAVKTVAGEWDEFPNLYDVNCKDEIIALRKRAEYLGEPSKVIQSVLERLYLIEWADNTNSVLHPSIDEREALLERSAVYRYSIDNCTYQVIVIPTDDDVEILIYNPANYTVLLGFSPKDSFAGGLTIERDADRIIDSVLTSLL